MFELFQKFVTIFVALFTAIVVESRLDKPQTVYEYGGKHD